MRLPVRMNIENRIFYPFLLIFLLFTALFGSVLYYNSYRSLLGQQTAVADLTLETITGEIREYGESSGREGILNACRRRGDVSLVIRDEAGVLLLGPESGAMESPWELSSRRDNPFGWKLSYVIDRSNFYDSLIDAQKYLLLATVALLVVTVQASVFGRGQYLGTDPPLLSGLRRGQPRAAAGRPGRAARVLYPPRR